MCQIKLNQVLDKNPELINSLVRYCIHPILQGYAHVLPNITVDGYVII